MNKKLIHVSVICNYFLNDHAQSNAIDEIN